MTQIWIHGLGQTPDSWNQMISLLGADDCICPDLSEMIRGNDAAYPNLYSAFSALCDAVDGKVRLCGLSLGGVLALNYAIDHPEKVESIILIAAQYKMPQKLLKFQNVIFRWMPKSMFDKIGFEKKDFLSLCNSMMTLDFSQSLQKIACPALIVCGGKDNANKDASKQLAKLLPDAIYHEICGCGHEVNMEAPTDLANVIGSFWKNGMPL